MPGVVKVFVCVYVFVRSWEEHDKRGARKHAGK